MPRVTIQDLGKVGVVTDIAPHKLDPAAWSSAKNVRFTFAGVKRFSGEKAVFGTPPIAPGWAMAVPGVSVYYWLYSDHASVYVWNGSSHTDITKLSTTYSGSADNRWVGTLLGGIPVMTNGLDAPQYWSSLSPATRLDDLLNWPVGVTCKSIRAFGPYLLALNVTKSGTNYPNMVKWSHPADPGSVPSSWDEADPTKDAGEVELTDVFAGGLVDGVALGNVFLVYKENSTHVLRNIGNVFVFDVDPLFSSIGILTTDCAVQVPAVGGVFLMTGDDIVLHGLQQGSIRSLITRRVRQTVLNEIDETNKKRSFVVSNELAQEVWFCYPEKGQGYATKALVWNYVDDSITFRDLDSIAFAAPGVVDESIVTDWDSDTGSWDSSTTIWDEGVVSAQLQTVLLCKPSPAEFRKVDSGSDFAGTPINAYMERSGLTLVNNRPSIDLEGTKLLRRIWIRASGGPFTVRIGAQDTENGAITWSSTETFTPGVDDYVDFTQPVSGRFLAVRFESIGGGDWTIEDYTLEVEPLGMF